MCNTCLPECPGNAIYEPGEEWAYADGTSLAGLVTLQDGTKVDAGTRNAPISTTLYYIVPGKCTDCQ